MNLIKIIMAEKEAESPLIHHSVGKGKISPAQDEKYFSSSPAIGTGASASGASSPGKKGSNKTSTPKKASPAVSKGKAQQQ